jgi:hypothetical protein
MFAEFNLSSIKKKVLLILDAQRNCGPLREMARPLLYAQMRLSRVWAGKPG